MSAVQITVRGSHSVRVPPEQATVHAALTGEGEAAEPVFRSVVAGLAQISASLESRHDGDRGPVLRYAVDQVRMGSHRPFHPDGTSSPTVHTATVSITATFADFDELADWVGLCARVDGFGISYIDWALTDARRLKVERKTRQKAVRDAARRAQDYADALDLGPVQVRAVSDPGGPIARKVMMASATAAADSGEFALRPDDVEIAAEVEAVFTVRPR